MKPVVYQLAFFYLEYAR